MPNPAGIGIYLYVCIKGAFVGVMNEQLNLTNWEFQ
jgi:hypothetical protein